MELISFPLGESEFIKFHTNYLYYKGEMSVGNGSETKHSAKVLKVKKVKFLIGLKFKVN